MKLLFGDLSVQQIQAIQQSIEHLPRNWDGTLIVPYSSDRSVRVIDLNRQCSKPRRPMTLHAHARKVK